MRAALVMGTGDWQKADELLEEALNLDPENAQAYFGKVLIQLKVSSGKMLVAKAAELGISSLNGYKDYKKALSLAEPDFRFQLQCYDPANLGDIYNEATALLSQPLSFDKCQKVLMLLEYIPQGYKEVGALSETVKTAGQAYQKYKQAIAQLNQSKSPTRFQDALAVLEAIQPIVTEIDAAAEKCRKALEAQAKAEKKATAKIALLNEIGSIDGVSCVTNLNFGQKHVHYKLRFFENEMVLEPGGSSLLNFSFRDVINAVSGSSGKHIPYAVISSVGLNSSMFGSSNILVVTMKNGRELEIKITGDVSGYQILSFIERRMALN